jgi:hypothetical protein
VSQVFEGFHVPTLDTIGDQGAMFTIRPRLFYLLYYGIASLKKTKSEEKNKSLHYHFSPAFSFLPLICVTNNTFFPVDHIGHA